MMNTTNDQFHESINEQRAIQTSKLLNLLNEVREDINELQRTHNNEVMRWFLQRIMLKIDAKVKKIREE